ncbi:hypothetical protein F4677DRAFT_79924 [Hypoxylon crocopeplum]|nr:hypothetical protein F4677DRAFT_79924 [Hypoxylon crocopeplum]
MRIISLVGLGLLAPNVFALDTHPNHGIQSPPIYILRTTQPATTALGKALNTLGYRPAGDDQRIPSNTYTEVSSVAQFVEITKSHSKAKFVVPQGSSQLKAEEDYVRFARAFLSEEKRSEELLELDVLDLEGAAQAENWVVLCTFLGMGYSMVERLSLWHFPG